MTQAGSRLCAVLFGFVASAASAAEVVLPVPSGVLPPTIPGEALLRDMVNWCILNPLEGKELAENEPRMKALEAYILQSRTGTAIAVGKH